MTNISGNLLLMAKDWQAGRSQAELVEALASLGFETIEIRREYFKSVDDEKEAIRQLQEAKGFQLFYSVPDEVFVNGALNPKLQTYLDEAKSMHVSKIKWNIGDFEGFQGDLKETLEPIVSQGIEVNIENDQTQTSGRIQPVQKFLEAAKAAGLDLGYVYDLGNWPFVGEKPEEAAGLLKDYVRYIHIKDDIISGEKPVTVPLDTGELDWRSILDVLPQDVPIALEYPTESTEVIEEGLEKLKAYLAER